MASGAAAASPRLPIPPGGRCTRPRLRVSAVAAAARARPRVPASRLVDVVAPALAVALQRAPVAAGRVAPTGLPAYPSAPPTASQATARAARAARAGGARPVVGGAVPPR